MPENSMVTARFGVNKNGKGKALVFNADLSNKAEADFALDLEAVAATKPGNLQEFITRLVDVQKIPKIPGTKYD